MPVAANRKGFLDSEIAVIMKKELMTMISSGDYNTGVIEGFEDTYIAKHLNYVSKFSYIDPHQYVMNLKMKSRI